MERPLVSVIMPAYNAENTIVESVRSVLAQTYMEFELIIVDDCSTDNTFLQIQELQTIDTRIKIFKNQRNSGVSFTRNFGVAQASAQWIAFLDSDDVWRPKKLEKQMNLLKKYPAAELLFTGSSFMDAQGNALSYVLEVPERITFKELLKQNVISCSSVLLARHWIEKIKMERDDMHEDFAVWLQILREIPYAYAVNEPLLVYRCSPTSKSGNKQKAAGMTYKVYRFVGLNTLQAAYYMTFYTIRSLKKYARLHMA